MTTAQCAESFVDMCRGAGLPGQGHLLYLGIGRGRFVGQLLAAAPKLLLVGLDRRARPLRQTLAAHETEGQSGRVSLQQSDAACLPYRDEAFAAVLSNGLLHHVPRPHEVLAEALRVLAPGGVVVVRDLRRPPGASARPRPSAAPAAQRPWLERCLLGTSDVRRLVSQVGAEADSSVQTLGKHWVWIARKR
jgi:ubiquinone/menaquinone biosynthesis C-methylase UbiE